MKIRVSFRKIDKGVFLNVLCIYQCLKGTPFAHRLAYTNPIMDIHERLSHKENSKANKKKKTSFKQSKVNKHLACGSKM